MNPAVGLSAQRSLAYVGDPMCAWSYGFQPAIAALRQRWPEIKIHVVMGGLRGAGEPMDAALRADQMQLWQAVARRTGRALHPDILAATDWLPSTEPACRAVVTARETMPGQGLELTLLTAIQLAHHRDALDTSDPEVLLELAESVGLQRFAFERAFDSEDMRQATLHDFSLSQRGGVRGFPCVFGVQAGHGQTLAPGWVEPAVLLQRVAHWIRD
jgi:putative protein-disulfide isomerase